MKSFTALLLTAVLLVSACVSARAVNGSDLSVQMVKDSANVAQVSAERCTFQCKYVNRSEEKTVAGVDLVYMALDSDRNISMNLTSQYIDLQITPQSTTLSPLIYITNQRELAYIVVGVQTVYFTDGTIEAIDFAHGETFTTAYFRVI